MLGLHGHFNKQTSIGLFFHFATLEFRDSVDASRKAPDLSQVDNGMNLGMNEAHSIASVNNLFFIRTPRRTPRDPPETGWPGQDGFGFEVRCFGFRHVSFRFGPSLAEVTVSFVWSRSDG